MTLAEVASRLQKAKPKTIKGCQGYNACCPAHEDKSPSFGVWEGADGWLHMKCQTGCSEEAILAALSMTNEDRRVAPTNGQFTKPDAVYRYTDEEGEYLFEKVRRPDKEGKKVFMQRIDKGSGEFDYKVSAALGLRSKILYRIAELKAAVLAGKPVYVCEGEKAVERMRREGLVATCQPGGATKDQPEHKWHPGHTAEFRGATVVVIADRDEVGEVYGRYVAKQLEKVAAKVFLVQSKTTREHDDAYDHFEAGFGRQEFEQLPVRAHRTRVVGTKFTAEGFEPVKVEFLWEPRMPKGKIVLWDADGGTQKSSLLLSIAAGFSIGQLPNGDGECEKARTAYFHKGEDTSNELATIFRANGGDFDYIEFFDDKQFGHLDDAGLEALHDILEQGQFGNAVFDALIYFCGHLQSEGWKDPQAILPTLQGLAHVGHATDACINNIRHTSKSGLGKEASALGFGSVQFRNSHRGQQVMRYSPREKGLVIVTDEKGSLLVPRAEPFAFRRQGHEIQYIADFDNPFDKGDFVAARNAAKEHADNLLARLLETGPKRARDIEQVGKDHGVSLKSLRAALKRIGGADTRCGFGKDAYYIWSIPQQQEEMAYNPFEED